MGTSSNEPLIVNHDLKPLGFGSIFLHEVPSHGTHNASTFLFEMLQNYKQCYITMSIQVFY
jgi:hypothetical protein